MAQVQGLVAAGEFAFIPPAAGYFDGNYFNGMARRDGLGAEELLL